jgi:hypothetical protein
MEAAVGAFATFPANPRTGRRLLSGAVAAALATACLVMWLAAPRAEARVLQSISLAVGEADRVHVRTFEESGKLVHQAWRDGEKLCYEFSNVVRRGAGTRTRSR